MNGRTLPKRFKVAFSLAGEQRDLVRKIAEAVEARLGPSSVFYDEWYEYYLAGADADTKLQKIFGRRCELAVVCVSHAYGDKSWTNAEHRAIRARHMKAVGSKNEKEKESVLPIRVGDGDVDGIEFNTIAPDARQKGVQETAQLIIDRLTYLNAEVKVADGPDWLDTQPELDWRVANHTTAHEKFSELLVKECEWQFLPIRGPSETGKSMVTRQMLSNARKLKQLTCGRFDFKGTTDLHEELRAFARFLDVDAPTGDRVTEKLSRILDDLSEREKPTLLIFDTYEAAEKSKDWVENQLLPLLSAAPWLRVVIAGQEVPKRSGTMWEDNTSGVVELERPKPKDWYEYGKAYRDDLTMENVEVLYAYAEAKPWLMKSLVGPKD